MSSDRIVYWTDGGHRDRCPRCGRSFDACRCSSTTGRPAPAPRSPAADGIVRVSRDRGGRHGKTVTVVTGISGAATEREKLAASLKRLCGSGGTVKDIAIEIQGDHRERVAARLKELGFTVKLAGG